MLEIALGFIAFSIAFLCISAIVYIRWHRGSLEKLGIPVVKPHFILGSNSQHDVAVGQEVDYNWFKTYGDVFGVYEGRTPKIYVCDPDFVRHVFIKEADKFPDRGLTDLFPMDEFGSEFMDFLEPEKWKAVRSAFSPAFTSSKLKKMSGQMRDASEEFAETIKSDIKNSKSGIIEDFNLQRNVYLMLIDMVARCSLNIKVENVRDPQNEFAVALTSLFQMTEQSAIVKKLKYVLPFLQKFSSGTKSLNNGIAFFEVVYKRVLDQRRQSGARNDDFIDMLIDLMEKVKSNDYKKLGITERTILANAVEFYIAGQDSMATAMTLIAFYVTKNPEIEKKLYEEVDDYFQRHNDQASYDTIHELVYLNACIQEALRLHPIFLRTDRKCAEDTEVKGIKIKKGMAVVVPLWPYNRNPKYFDDPDTFNPERFMPHNKDKLNPMALATFGWGPRMCIGMRFALEGLAFTGLYIFKNFKFTTKPGAEVGYLPGQDIFAFVQNVPLDIQLR